MNSTSLGIAVGIVACGASGAALATPAVLDWQILRRDSVIVTATVLGGLAKECLPREVMCFRDHSIGLTLRVHGVLAAATGAPTYHTGDFARVVTYVAYQTRLSGRSRKPAMRSLIISPRSHALTAADVARLFGGKQYIFGLSYGSADGSIAANVWDPQQQSWIEEKLKQHALYGNSSCPRLV